MTGVFTFHMASCSFERRRKGDSVVDAELELGDPREGRDAEVATIHDQWQIPSTPLRRALKKGYPEVGDILRNPGVVE